MSDDDLTAGPARDAKVPLDFDAMVAESKAYGDKHSVSFIKGGVTFMIPGPLDWSDEFVQLQAHVQATGNADPVAMAHAILGEEQYARFRALGGNAMRFMAFFDQAFGDKPGESSAS